jgi:hypothetical protein
MTPCKFVFIDSPPFDGFAQGTTWNGFDNVAVTPEVLREIVAWFREGSADDPDMEEANQEMLDIEPMANGLISLAYGYATVIVEIEV